MAKLPVFGVTYQGLMGYFLVKWEDDGCSFHIWVNEETLKPVVKLAKNTVVLYRKKPGHSDVDILDFNAKKYGYLRALVDLIPKAAYEVAKADFHRKEAAKKDACEQSRRAKNMETLLQLAAKYGFHLIQIEGACEQ